MNPPEVRTAEVIEIVSVLPPEAPLIEPAELSVDPQTIIEEMQRVAPPGQERIEDPTVVERLRLLTKNLLFRRGSAPRQEYERFQHMPERGLPLDNARLLDQLQGRTIIVTGGTGCIGTKLLEQLRQFGPARIVSVSRGETEPLREVEGVEYHHVDIRDANGLATLFGAVKPDIVYHLAAQHDPSKAEIEVNRTLGTNIVGTDNVVTAAETYGAQVVYASTGKALRPVSDDIYAGSKKAGEKIVADAAQRGKVLCSAVRFTHVVDNSIIADRVDNWIDNGEPIRLHGAEVGFYLQSALEAAQLLLNSGLEAERGTLTIQTIRDLGAPACLLDLALGAIETKDKPAAVYICGYESGYEAEPYVGMYDPKYDEDQASRLINAWEAPETKPSESCPEVDRTPFAVAHDAELDACFDELAKACADNATDEELREIMDTLAWKMLEARLRRVPVEVLKRNAIRMSRIPPDMIASEHRRINNVLFRVYEETAASAAQN